MKKAIPVPVPVPDDFKHWPLMMLYTAVIWGEARGESNKAKIAVAWVIRNRFIRNGWFGDSLRAVLTKKYQFSCLNPNDVNSQKVRNPLYWDDFKVWAECYEIAEKVHNGEIKDPTGGATHYFDKSLKDNPPYWAKKLTFTKKIGSFYFYK